MKKLNNFFKRLTKKQILVIGTMIPLGFVFGIALRIGLTKKGTELEKYNVNSFLRTDTLKIDTALVKRGELYTDTLVDYYKLSKKEISFKTLHYDIKPNSFLSVYNEEISKYKLLKNGIPSEEIIGQNNENKNYHLIGNFFSRGFELNKLELMRYGTTSNFLNDAFKINNSHKKDTNYNIYTKDTDLGKKILESEQKEVEKYLSKILEYKKKLGD